MRTSSFSSWKLSPFFSEVISCAWAFLADAPWRSVKYYTVGPKLSDSLRAGSHTTSTDRNRQLQQTDDRGEEASSTQHGSFDTDSDSCRSSVRSHTALAGLRSQAGRPSARLGLE